MIRVFIPDPDADFLPIPDPGFVSRWCGSGSCLSLWCGSRSCLSLWWIRILLCTFHFDADPDPSFPIKAQNLEKCKNRLLFHTFWLVICKLMRIRIRIQAITLMRIRIRTLPFHLMRIRIHTTGWHFRNNCVRFKKAEVIFVPTFICWPRYYGVQVQVLYGMVLYLRWAFHHHCDATYCPPL